MMLFLRGVLPAAFAIAMGCLSAQSSGVNRLRPPWYSGGAIFVPLQVLPPIHRALGANLGSRTAAWLYDRLTARACGRRASDISKTRRSSAT